MKTGGNYSNDKNYYIRLWNNEQSEEKAVTIIQFNSYFKAMFHDENHEKDFSDLTNALKFCFDKKYHFYSKSIQLKAV